MPKDNEHHVPGHCERPEYVCHREPGSASATVTSLHWEDGAYLDGDVHLERKRLEATQSRFIARCWPTHGDHCRDEIEEIEERIDQHDPMLKLGRREFHPECAPMSLDGDVGLFLGETVVGISHLHDGTPMMDRGEGVATQKMAEMTREMEEKQNGWGIEALCDLKHYYAICHHCDSLIEIHQQALIAFSTSLSHILATYRTDIAAFVGSVVFVAAPSSPGPIRPITRPDKLRLGSTRELIAAGKGLSRRQVGGFEKISYTNGCRDTASDANPQADRKT
ncbi:predicted protein [Aspergillus nidulans FGSC A4]|uniref:Uncharacterized protein n=1 Tax=Emericella nidulans (strain FGSC A4 / ATCC 38163 / CBS 112.46 / NRRL 194 / M139) TaxID=227321 RepID=Q5ATN2_EMENI|nr:protein gprI [Aspergillus nidulans FGSC A4]EAA66910.1 predicted protein [Aspergillus nidulans FGSC A4]CBF80357.1 TPA: conserved hypothetical protein [Aspergillus nidulans FGSC A4]|eukprot:XP_681617.1 predicted protein [Aspergillus nidulans FGSC A4]